jgi:hypothetical protein
MVPVRRSKAEVNRTRVVSASANRITLSIDGKNERFVHRPQANQEFSIPKRS